MPSNTSIDAEVDVLHGEDGYSLAARFNARVPGVPRESPARSWMPRTPRARTRRHARTVPMELTLA